MGILIGNVTQMLSSELRVIIAHSTNLVKTFQILHSEFRNFSPSRFKYILSKNLYSKFHNISSDVGVVLNVILSDTNEEIDQETFYRR